MNITALQFHLGDRMAKARDAAAISTQAMAQRLNVSRQTIGNYESGRTRPNYSTLVLWAQITGAPIEWLETGDTPSERGEQPHRWFEGRDQWPTDEMGDSAHDDVPLAA